MKLEDTRHNYPVNCYSISRPVRVAFLLPIGEWADVYLKKIFTFSCQKWGGKNHVIIPIIDDQIPTNYRKLLEYSDPDIIYSFGTPSSDIIKHIEAYISPTYFVQHRERDGEDYGVNLPIEIIPIDPLVPNLKEIFPNIFEEPILFCPKYYDNHPLSKFLTANFGYYNSEVYSKGKLLASPPLAIEVESPIEIFEAINGNRNLVFPISLCMAQCENHGAYSNAIPKEYKLIASSDPLAWILHWNLAATENKLGQRRMTSLCIPPSFLQNKDLLPELAKFIYNKLDGSRPALEFIGSENDFNIVNTIFGKRWVMFNKNEHGYADYYPLERSYGRSFIDFSNPSEREEYRGERFLLKPPMPKFGMRQIGHFTLSSVGNKFIVELEMEINPESEAYTNKSFPWKLPPKQHLSSAFFGHRPGRIVHRGVMAAVVGFGERNIEIRIPSPNTIFYLILCESDRFWLTDDIRKGKFLKAQTSFRPSDKGRYLEGVLGLVPSFYHAKTYLLTRFWTRIIEKMAGTSEVENNSKYDAVYRKINKYKKMLISTNPTGSDDGVKWLTNKVFQLAQSLKSPDFTFTFKFIADELIKDRELIIANPAIQHNVTSSQSELISNLHGHFQELIELEIFFQGIKPQCPNCLSSFWYYLNEINQTLICKGCRVEFQLGHGSEWHFRLNELVMNCYTRQGILALLWTLSDLEGPFTDSFIYLPSQEFFKDRNSSSPTFEVDLLCIRNGRLILGEVKSNTKEFSNIELEKAKVIILQFEPDVFMLSGLKGDEANLIEAKSRLEALISGLKTKIEILHGRKLYEEIDSIYY